MAGQFTGVRLDFTPGSFTGGKTLRFGLDRDEFRSAFNPTGSPSGDSRNGSSGDLAGSNVRFPAGTTATGGITFTGVLADGSTFSGVMTNRIGAGYRSSTASVSSTPRARSASPCPERTG